MSGNFAHYLSPKETIRWSGAPQQGIVFRAVDALLIPFSLLWCGFAVFWEAGVWTSGAPTFMMVWGGFFVCIGLYIVIGRFFWDAFLRSRMQYALTDQRALILGGVMGNELMSIDLHTTSEIRYKDLDGSRGTISFGPHQSPFLNRDVWRATSSGMPEFFRVQDAASAYRFIQAAKSGVKANV